MNAPRLLYSVADIRRIEQAALASLPARTLMQRAGQAAAEFALELLAGCQQRRILLLAGPGNNGGDAFETASRLAQAGCETVVMHASPADTLLPTDAAEAYQEARANGKTRIVPADTALVHAAPWSLVVDGLFGIGLARPLAGPLRALVEAINRLDCPIVALDVPSGLDAGTGMVIGGRDGIAVHAAHTVTFIGDKPGLHTGDGRDYAGEVHVRTLSVAPAPGVPTMLCLNDPSLFGASLRPRRQNSHKGNYGDMMVLGGALGTVGAALLAARAGAHCGAGRVLIASPDDAIAYDPAQPELMCRPARQCDLQAEAVVAGPGLGTTEQARTLLARAIATSSPLVLDADALNLLAEDTALRQQLRTRGVAAIVTPHPLEAARLLGVDTHDVQADRLAAARALAEKLHATAVLKGSGTVIALADGRTVINDTGNPALATAGSGDVLSGVCGALLAQGWPADAAACGTVWLHGKAADDMVAQGIGPVGVTAGELVPFIRAALNRAILQQVSRHPAG